MTPAGRIAALALVLAACGSPPAPPAAPAEPSSTATQVPVATQGTPPARATAAAAAPTPTPAPCAPVLAPGAVTPSTTSYAGPLFETHLHKEPGAPRTANGLCSYLAEEGTTWAILFQPITPATSAAQTSAAKDYADGGKGRVISLLGPGGVAASFVQGAYTEAWLRPYVRPQGPFAGFGEIGMYGPETQDMPYATSQFEAVLRVLNGSGGILMIHPRDGQRRRPQDASELDALMTKYPKVIFLFHTSADDVTERDILPLVQKHANALYTYDWNHMVRGSWGFLRVEADRISDAGDTRGAVDRYLTDIARVGEDTIVSENVSRLSKWLQLAPDRILWGTDRSPAWTYDARTRDVMIGITRRIIAGLAVAYQEKFAFRNAMAVFSQLLGE